LGIVGDRREELGTKSFYIRIIRREKEPKKEIQPSRYFLTPTQDIEKSGSKK